jgi:hypothetical protein
MCLLTHTPPTNCGILCLQTLTGLAFAVYNGSLGSYSSALPLWALTFNRWAVERYCWVCQQVA